MRRRRVVAAAPVRSATTAWAAIVELIVDTVDASASIEASGVRREIDKLGAVGPQLVAAGHLEEHAVTLISGTADVDITTASGIAGTTLEENLSRVSGAATADRWDLYIPAPDPIGPIVESAIGAAAHIHVGPAPTARSTTKNASVDLLDRDALRNLGSSS